MLLPEALTYSTHVYTFAVLAIRRCHNISHASFYGKRNNCKLGISRYQTSPAVCNRTLNSIYMLP